VPRSVSIRASLPKNAAGKVLRRVLRDEPPVDDQSSEEST